MSIERMTAIVKHRWETGAYGGTHFEVTPAVLDELRPFRAAKPPNPAIGGQPFGDLMGIPIVVDESLPAGEWRLVDPQTGAVLYRGRVEP